MEYKGKQIEINKEGFFEANLDGAYITAESFKEIKKKMNNVLKPKIRIKAFCIDRWGRDWDDPKLPEEIEITSYAGDSEFWVVSVEEKMRRKVNAIDLFPYDKEIAERIFELNKEIKKSLDEIEGLKENNHYKNSELLEKLRINTQKIEKTKQTDVEI